MEQKMTQLKTLTFAALLKASAADPTIHRRNKLIVRLQQQVQLAQDPNFSLTRQKWIADETGVKQLRELRKKVRAWWRTDPTGAVVLTVRHGARAIEFARGKAAIAVGKKEKLIPTIETVIAAVEAGELDAVLGQMSKTAVMTKGKRAA
jgi:ABC-type amino acid transport substrate-binding protein